jgi:hypothetical protein
VRRALVALAAALMLAGCSLEEDQQTSPWVERADAVCAEHVDEFAAVVPFTSEALDEIQDHDISPGTFAELERWAGDFLTVGALVERDLERLGEPPAEARPWLELNERNGEALGQVRAAAARRDEEGVYRAFERQGELSAEFMELSQELGFLSCGTVVSD